MRNRVVAELRRAPDGLGVRELTERVGLHPNSVRWHLASLERDGVVVSAPLRTMRPGRPRIIYRLRPAGLAGTREEYRLLATVLTGTVAASGGERAATAGGRAWGRRVVPRPPAAPERTPERAIDAVVAVLEEQGFAPERDGREIRIRRCPFHELADAQRDVVCSVHRGMIEGALDELGADARLEELDVLVEPDLCVARISPGSSRPQDEPPGDRPTA